MAENTCSQCGSALNGTARYCDNCGSPSPSSTGVVTSEGESLPPIRAGDVLDGKWRVERKLGQGGMGSVFLAHDLALDRKVALKALAPALCNDHEFVTRFEREARMTARLEHPNIVPVYSVGRHHARPFIVMKKLTGESLAGYLRRHATEERRPAREEVLHLLKQLCAGLHYIHTNGFVHRDLKPGNIYVGEDLHLTILDFGVLRDTQQSGQGLTRSGTPLGTPHYMAPEQATGAKDVDARADLYSVGVVLYEIIGGATPFDSPSPLSVLRMHATLPPPDIRTIAPLVPIGVATALEKALAKRPDDRFQKALELYEAVEAAWTPEPALAPAIEPVAPPPSLPTPVAPPAARPAPATPTPPVALEPPLAPLLDELPREADAPPEPEEAEEHEPFPARPAPPVDDDDPSPLHLRPPPKRVTRPMPLQRELPETPDEVFVNPERKAQQRRKLFLAMVVIEVLVVLGVLGWAFWPEAPKVDPLEPTLPDPVAAPVHPAGLDAGAPTPIKLPVRPLPLPGAKDPLAPPDVDFKPPEDSAPPSFLPPPAADPAPAAPSDGQ